jgi:hypothetical protein
MDSNENYKNKYLKYKFKYYILKKQLGGIWFLAPVIARAAAKSAAKSGAKRFLKKKKKRRNDDDDDDDEDD